MPPAAPRVTTPRPATPQKCLALNPQHPSTLNLNPKPLPPEVGSSAQAKGEAPQADVVFGRVLDDPLKLQDVLIIITLIIVTVILEIILMTNDDNNDSNNHDDNDD